MTGNGHERSQVDPGMKSWGALMVVLALAIVVTGPASVAAAQSLSKSRATAKARQVARHTASERGALPSLAQANCLTRVNKHRFKCAFSWVPRISGVGACVGKVTVFNRKRGSTVFAARPTVRCGFGGPTTDLEEGPAG